ncbi:MAG: Gfo/Idh/MocA family oxidoreductase [Candidatus Marinimicrobia bacterium]|nr:Gfo/Idh/MocA family oxidoreductase [Candidatus Neomarinimicrobiota bacterium]MCF7880634.1 Gfo/Idh/MocA family oxidoreductase [Candidatus Neomarinimicrobiota bacterium]
MEKNDFKMDRREFITKSGTAAAGVMLAPSLSGLFAQASSVNKMKLAMVGTGHRGTGMWGKSVANQYGDYVEFVGLCDINSGRVEWARQHMGVNCPTYTDFEKMINETHPDVLIVTTIDATHHEFIIKGMQMGCDIITEKPMTTDEKKCQAILDAERETGQNVIVTFNYRYSPHRRKIKEMIMEERVGKILSADFNWYLDIYHGAAYFRRWHRLRENSGTLLVHKSTHHFDLMNWWLDTDPQEVTAFGDLDFYGKNNDFRYTNCRPCPHKEKCDFYWDITQNERYMEMYVENEEYDGYLRDGCVFREDIDIYDKRTLSVKYANNTLLSYSLINFAPYEGYRIAFNGTKGRIEAWIHERQPWPRNNYDEIRVTDNFGETELIKIPHGGGGHGGGDTRLKDKIFKDPDMADPLKQSAGTRDGAMSILVGIAADKSIQQGGQPVKIADLTDLAPQAVRPS